MTDALLIHIGDCKAGSTSIQTVLRDGSWTAPGEVRGGGGSRPLRYAATGRDDGLNHHMLSNSLFIEGLAERRPLMHKALASEAAESASPLLVLSSERYEFAPPEALAEALRRNLPDLPVRLIAYVRPHAERLVSGWSQQVKQGLFAGSLEAFHDATLAEGRFRYAPRLRAWRAAFGDRLEVRPMIRARLTGGCAAHDFLTWALGEGAAPSAPVETNASPRLPDLALLARLGAEGPAGRRLAAALAGAMERAGPASGPAPALSRALAAQSARDYAEDAAAVDAEQLAAPALAEALAAAPDRAPESAPGLDAPGLISPETARLHALWIEAATVALRAGPGHGPRRGGGGPGAAAAQGPQRIAGRGRPAPAGAR
ncbi:MAG: hypothetical protein VYD87_01115 [Pseudomonadota bacterium]|nr:hypothetical protein [Pseudomonadota bacterium]